MSQPTQYTRQYDFTGHSTTRPNTPQPGVQLDAEFNQIRNSLNSALNNLALIQRDDTGLANGSVGIDQLDSVVQAIIAGSGFTVKGDWAASTAYVPGDLVANDGKIYLVLEAHNSSASLAADIASGYVSVALFAPHALLDFEAELAATGGAALIGTTTASNSVQELLDSIRAAIGIAGAASNMGAFTTTVITDNQTVKTGMEELGAAVEAVQADADAAQATADTKSNASAVGVTSSAANMGTYTGSTITDNQTAKQNIQELETAVELRLPRFADRTALAAVSTTLAAVYDAVYLWESGREGIFVWSSANNATNVTNDPGQGVYVPPSSDTTGASGAWVRDHKGELDVRFFGAVGDGTDATTAMSRAIATAQYLGVSKVVCKDPSKSFKIIELQITDDIEIDMGGASILGDFGAWGTSSVDATPIYWTKNILYSEEADAPSVTLRNIVFNGQNDPNFQMAGGTPLIDFRGGASPGSTKVVLDRVTMTRGSNRRYTTGSGISAPTLLLDYRNMEILLYNIDTVWIDDCILRSSPGEMLQIQSDDARTIFHINRLYATKTRDQNPAQKWSSSGLNVLNCHPSSGLRDSHFYFFGKGPVNWEMDGGTIENSIFDYVDDSSGIDFCEASSYRFDNHTVRGCYFKSIVTAGIRSSGSNETFENNVFEDVNIPVLFNAGVVGNIAQGAWLKVNQVPLVNNLVRNCIPISFDASHANKQTVRVLGVSASIYVAVTIDGVARVDRMASADKPVNDVYATYAQLNLKGRFANGNAALVYLTGEAKVHAQDCTFEPEAGEGAHVFELNSVTMGPRDLVLENCERQTALDAGWYDFRNTSATLDRNTIHINNSPDFAGTTNSAIISRDNRLKGSVAFDPGSIAVGGSATTTVTVSGCRVTDADAVIVTTSVSAAGLTVTAYVSANDTVTVVYANNTAGAVDLANHTVTVYVFKTSN